MEELIFYIVIFVIITIASKWPSNSKNKIVLKDETEPSGILKSFQLPCQSYIELDSYDPESKEGTLIKRHNLDLSLLDEAAVKMLFKQDYPFVSEEYKRYTYDQFTAYVIDFSSGFIKSIKNSSYEAINSLIEIESENEILMSNL
ncbi:hypothetical protein [Zobellia uliginosa]|uniref:hypothetical protein n=1 Tax=Zobellia uliginosa TaxID=143224 RepID=UPI0026E31896|nr:hypothetical protein [Zobellia uliginosa]MDO6519026.1 hypothetical protein [Zobellia uliginosa]